ncbi:MAG TPA: RluA family pseudouridine synthase [Thermoanaerobaculia bacterium]|nr:RluA family pseudouridine synthase [Thermoanaerobaculia bacterium]
MRLDQAVAARNAEISRRQARDLIAQRRVLVNDRPVAVASREVSDRDRIAIVDAHAELDVIRETNDWIAINKPSGLPAQPVRGRDQRSLEELLRMRYREIFVVHRIDTQTSGVIVFAKTRTAAARLSELFASRQIRKTYLAAIEGALEGETRIDAPIEGKEALTIVRPLRDGLVEAEILTGRMHQIRIHLSSIGHPVIGDRRYGSKAPAERMLLHAWKLEHPSLGELVAPPPAELAPV